MTTVNVSVGSPMFDFAGGVIVGCFVGMCLTLLTIALLS